MLKRERLKQTKLNPATLAPTRAEQLVGGLQGHHIPYLRLFFFSVTSKLFRLQKPSAGILSLVKRPGCSLLTTAGLTFIAFPFCLLGLGSLQASVTTRTITHQLSLSSGPKPLLLIDSKNIITGNKLLTPTRLDSECLSQEPSPCALASATLLRLHRRLQ